MNKIENITQHTDLRANKDLNLSKSERVLLFKLESIFFDHDEDFHNSIIPWFSRAFFSVLVLTPLEILTT